jgi:putative tricarboxylic transport membrane protein
MSERRDSPTVVGGLTIRNPQDFVGGLVLIGIALFALWASSDLPGMRGFQFGPGTAPRLFAMLLAGIGAIVALMALLIHGPGIPQYAWRGPMLVTASILLFAVTIRPLGMVIASFIMFVFAASGSKETRWIEATLAAAGMTVFCTLLFVYLLGLPFQLWPRFTIAGITIAF